jgi:hypothetical protein
MYEKEKANSGFNLGQRGEMEKKVSQQPLA